MRGIIRFILIIFILISILPIGHVMAASGLQLYNYTEKKNINYTGNQIKVTYQGNKISNDLSLGVRINGVELVSYYDVFAKSKIGASCSYNKDNGCITIKKNGNCIILKLGSKEANFNGNKVKLTAAPILIKFIKSNVTKIMVPVQFVTEALGYGYTYLGSKNEIVIKSYLYGTIPGNTSQGSKFIYQDGWLYTTIFDTFLYKLKPEGSQRQWIDIYNSENLNFKDGHIYYLSSNVLYRNTLNGLHPLIINQTQHILKYIIYDKYIYYVNMDDNKNIYRMNLDGSGRVKLTSDKNCLNLYVTKSYIFYSSNNGLYRINRNGSYRIKLSSFGVTNIVSDSKYLYFINSRNLYIFKSNFDGTTMTQLSNDVAISLNISGNVLYYQNQYDYNKLYAITTEGKAKTIIVDEATYNPTIVDDYLYYIPEKNSGYTLHRVKLKELEEEINNPEAVGNFVGNIINDAFTAYSDSNIYFCDPWLYKIPVEDKDINEFKQYTYKDHSNFYEINVVGDYIYCTVAKHIRDTNYGGGIYKIKEDGTQPPIKLTNLNADYLTVIGNWMYFTVGSYDSNNGSGPIYKMKIDGSELKAIYESRYGSARCLNIIGNYIYFINEKDHSSIYRMNLDGKDVKRLSTDDMVYTFQVYGDDIYYHNLNNRSIMKMPKDGGTGTVILSVFSPKMIVYGDRIYCFRYNSNDGHTSLYSCKLDGTDMTRLKSEVLSEYLNITGGFVYYKNNDGNHTIEKINLNNFTDIPVSN